MPTEDAAGPAFPTHVDASDVVSAYRLFLGRDPESMAAVDAKVGQSGKSVVTEALLSDEFRRRMAGTIGDGGRLIVPPGVASGDLRRWGARFFAFDENARRSAAAVDDRHSLLALALDMPLLGQTTDAVLGRRQAAAIAERLRMSLACTLKGFTSPTDVAFCYRLILGRAPETDIADWPDAPLAATIASFLGSEEFTREIALPALRGSIPYAATAPTQMREWLARTSGTKGGDDLPTPAAMVASLLELPAIAGDRALGDPGWRPAEVARALRTAAPGGRTPRPPLPPVPLGLPVDASLLKGIPLERINGRDGFRLVPIGRSGAPISPGLEAVAGSEWILIAPLDCVLAPDFSKIVRHHAARSPNAGIFYADDFAQVAGQPVDQLRLKPAFDAILLGGQDYVGAPIIVKADAFRELGGLDPGHGTAASADLLFRAHAAGVPIQRIAEVLLAWPGERIAPLADDYRAMLAAQPIWRGCDFGSGLADGSLAIWQRFACVDQLPVTIVVPTRRAARPDGRITHVEELLDALAATDWEAGKLTVIVGDDVAGDPAWTRRRWPFELRHVHTRRDGDQPFNYAAKMNELWCQATTEQLVFLNDDVVPSSPSWLRALLTFATMPAVGGVGARLVYPDDTIQHAGLAPSGDGAAHLWLGLPDRGASYQQWAMVHRQWSMVTGAVFATRRSIMSSLGGFDERFTLEFNDTDLCLRLREQGYWIVYTPHARFVHAEKASRGETPPPPGDRLLYESRWRAWLDDDPSWHPAMDEDVNNVRPRIVDRPWYA